MAFKTGNKNLLCLLFILINSISYSVCGFCVHSVINVACVMKLKQLLSPGKISVLQLIVLTPKSLLRHPEAKSSFDEMVSGRSKYCGEIISYTKLHVRL